MKRIGIGSISNGNPTYTYLLTITQKNYVCKFFCLYQFIVGFYWFLSFSFHYSENEIF